jgi:TRAP-type C4-dicarboxylate transport system permease small subunit
MLQYVGENQSGFCLAMFWNCSMYVSINRNFCESPTDSVPLIACYKVCLHSTTAYCFANAQACIAQKEHTLKMNVLPESQTKTKKLSDTFWTFCVT